MLPVRELCQVFEVLLEVSGTLVGRSHYCYNAEAPSLGLAVLLATRTSLFVGVAVSA